MKKREPMEKLGRKNGVMSQRNLFIFFVPAIAFALVFCYVPMAGLVMAFKENPNMFGSSTAIQGILDAKWVGFANFSRIFANKEIIQALKNTLIISTLKITILFPIPIFLAIMIHEMRGRVIRKSLEITMYLPYFLSWATIGGIFIALLNKDMGLVNNVLSAFGHERVAFITNKDTFRAVLVLSSGWKDIGWSTVTYMAAISSLDYNQVEAAKIDGASKWQQIRHITLPGILPVIAVMFVMRIGYLLNAGFEQVFIFYSPYIKDTGDILGTYTYRLIREASMMPQYAISTAVGLFESVASLILVLGGNYFSKKFFKQGIW